MVLGDLDNNNNIRPRHCRGNIVLRVLEKRLEEKRRDFLSKESA
jgi:hypothetical protein